MLAGSVSPEASPGLVDGCLPPVSSHGASCSPIPRPHHCVSVSSSPLLVRTPVRVDQGPPQRPHFNHLFKGLLSKYSHIPRSWGWGSRYNELEGEAQFIPQQPHFMDCETEAEKARSSRVVAVLGTVFLGYIWACPTLSQGGAGRPECRHQGMGMSQGLP